jgi:hypothetical protein
VVAVAVSLVLSTALGAFAIGGAAHSGSARHQAPGAVTRGALSTGPAVNPWILNDTRYSSAFLQAPISTTSGSSGLLDPEEERHQLLDLVEAGAPLQARTTTWTQSGTGALINRNGSTLAVAAVTNSLDGDGAVVSKVTLNGSGGTDTAVRYQANGVGTFKETFTNGAPDANGVIPYTGRGTCTGGTGVHRREKCSYSFTGSYDPKTSVVSFTITGTTIR